MSETKIEKAAAILGRKGGKAKSKMKQAEMDGLLGRSALFSVNGSGGWLSLGTLPAHGRVAIEAVVSNPDDADAMHRDWLACGFDAIHCGMSVLTTVIADEEGRVSTPNLPDGSKVHFSTVAVTAPSAAAVLGRKGGASKSKAKASAARANGKKGGRPRIRPSKP